VASRNTAVGPFSLPETVTNGVDLSSTPPGQFLEVTITFDRADGFDPSPVLFDITLLYNRTPDCSGAYPSRDSLWPPTDKFVDIDVRTFCGLLARDPLFADRSVGQNVPLTGGVVWWARWVSNPRPSD